MSTKAEAKLIRASSHSVKFGCTVSADEMSGIDKEELYLTFTTTWRGADVVVQMGADRYRHSSGVSDWRIYPANAIEGSDPYGRGKALTDTARRRLSEQLTPLVEAFIAGDEYPVSRARAVVGALVRELAERSYSHPPSRRASEFAIRIDPSVLTGGQWVAFRAACDAKDAAQAALEAFGAAE